jgi:hypothetical protein
MGSCWTWYFGTLRDVFWELGCIDGSEAVDVFINEAGGGTTFLGEVWTTAEGW